MNFYDAIILGVVEGITEFLPISSTGHLILAGRCLGLTGSEFQKSFDIAIQLGAILSVVVLYGRSLLVKPAVLTRVAAAFIPTALLGLIFYKIIKKVLLNNEPLVLAAMLIGGVLLIIFEKFHKEDAAAIDAIQDLPYTKAIWLGVFQSLAMVPGVSRSAATIVGGLLLGLKRKTIVEFSFLLAVPTMLAATALDLLKTSGQFSAEEFSVLAVGFTVSFWVALLSIKFLLHYIKSHNFVIFGVYRIAAALLFWKLILS